MGQAGCRCIGLLRARMHFAATPRDRFVEQCLQREVLPASRLQWSLVGTEYRTEWNMDQLGGAAVWEAVPADRMNGGKDIAEVIALPGIDTVDDALCTELCDAIVGGGEVRGGVEARAIGLLNEQRAFTILETHDEGALIALGETCLDKGIHGRRELIAEETLAAAVRVIERDPKRGRRVEDFAHRDGNEALPRCDGWRIAALQPPQRFVGVFQQGRGTRVLRFELRNSVRTSASVSRCSESSLVVAPFRLRSSVGVVEVVERYAREVDRRAFEGRKGHRDGQSPVAEVVLSEHRPSKPLMQSSHRVADDRSAQMTDMQLLCHIDAAQVDGDPTTAPRQWDAERLRIHVVQRVGDDR